MDGEAPAQVGASEGRASQVSESRQPSSQVAGTPPALVSALNRLLRPLVKLLLANRMPFPFLANMLKALYVEVATAADTADGRRPTDSRVTLQTGVHRKDVKRLRAEPSQRHRVPESLSLGGQLAQRWLSAPGYQDPDGHPLPLSRSPERAGAPNFDELVESVSKDIRPRAVLEELLELGVAVLDEKRRICLRVEGFVPERGFDERCYYVGRSLRDHISTAAHNLSGGQPALFERSVYYTELSEASVQELDTLVHELVMDVLTRFNRRAAQLKERDMGGDDRRFRITLGSYFYRELLENPALAPERDPSGTEGKA